MYFGVVRVLLPSDDWYINKCRELVHTKTAPIHSGLLVCAVIKYVDKRGRLRFATGINGEPCVIAGSLCAERAALMKVFEADGDWIDTVYITASCLEELTPGTIPPRTRARFQISLTMACAGACRHAMPSDAE